MIDLRNMVWVEWKKLLRARLPWLAMLGFLILPLVAAFFMIIMRDPQLAADVGILRTKAAFIDGAADWPTYLDVLSQGIAVGSIFVFGLVAAWVFGREFSDDTVDDLLAMPVARGRILIAKFAVISAWCLLMATVIYLVSITIGFALELPLGSRQLLESATGVIAAVTLQMVALSLPVALAASMGRGYLPAVGYILLTLAAAQIAAIIGWGEFFPWSVPALSAGMIEGVSVGPASYWLVAITGMAGIAATIFWWQKADYY